MMESPGTFPESPMEQDDVAYPCKGCGEILEEGKAFELAGNRWHIDCFRCNTCNTLLDSDANLLLLGDGSLICNSCTYSCSACGNKIEDLAILTGEQAYCASCFRCRNCKRKIENLRYARTSQGIFCMTCHESLMARRKKKARAAAAAAAAAAQQQKPGSNSQSPMLLDKSLPSLPPKQTIPPIAPPSVPSQPVPGLTDIGTPHSEAYSETPTELSPRPNNSNASGNANGNANKKAIPPKSSKRERSPLPREDTSNDTILLPSTTYNGTPTSTKSLAKEMDGAIDNKASTDPFGAFIPLVFDDRVTAGPSPLVKSQTFDSQAEPDRPSTKAKEPEKDYFHVPKTRSENRDAESRVLAQKKIDSPHVAYQERGRQPSSELTDMIRNRSKRDVDRDMTSSNLRSVSSPDDTKLQLVTPPPNGIPAAAQADKFKLQEAPKSKKASTPGSKSEVNSPQSNGSREGSLSMSKTDSPVPNKSNTSSSSRNDSLQSSDSPLGFPKPRNDSLQQPGQKSNGPKIETSTPSSRSGPPSPRMQEWSPSATSAVPAPKSPPMIRANGFSTSPRMPESSEARPIPPARAKARGQMNINDSFPTPPRAPLPGSAGHEQSPRSGGTLHTDSSRDGEGSLSPALPQYSVGADFSMEEDLARILNSHDESSNSLLRRVSNAVRHGRSFSDVAGRNGPASVHTDTLNSDIGELSTPAGSSPESKEQTNLLKHELRRSQQRIAELEARVGSTADIRSLDSKLREKRSTVAFLDSQKEIVVRELEVLTEHLTKAKNTDGPVDLDGLSNSVIREFAVSLEKLKDDYMPEIEELIHQKNQLLEENSKLVRLRDQAIQETEQLNLKNAQLADLNNELTHQIQERYKANRSLSAEPPMSETPPRANGLGIYTHHHKDRSDVSTMDQRDYRPMTAGNNSSYSTLIPASSEQNEGEPVTVLSAPHVVNIRKGQAKKFNWKKGGQSVAKGVTKGFKGAFSSNPQNQQYGREGQLTDGTPYQTHQPGEAPTMVNRIHQQSDLNKAQPFNIFTQRLGGSNSGGRVPQLRSHSNGNLAPMNTEGAAALFGTDLIERTEFERRQIPSIVTRCIEEVELRGMDIEGIYRKTGGNSLVKILQEGFERTDDYDISDPGLDITAVTSVLKQYFRKLPIPLFTYEVYDKMLESNDPSIQDAGKRIELMRAAINSLPGRHRDCLEFLIFHLARVATRDKENLMTPKNLAVVFAPTIMRDTSLEREMTDMHTKNAAVQFLIENNKMIFSPV